MDFLLCAYFIPRRAMSECENLLFPRSLTQRALNKFHYGAIKHRPHRQRRMDCCYAAAEKYWSCFNLLRRNICANFFFIFADNGKFRTYTIFRTTCWIPPAVLLAARGVKFYYAQRLLPILQHVYPGGEKFDWWLAKVWELAAARFTTDL
jgi:hypothetical protein